MLDSPQVVASSEGDASEANVAVLERLRGIAQPLDARERECVLAP